MQQRHSPLHVYRHPVFWLLVASAATAFFMWREGDFKPVRNKDTPSYVNVSIPVHQEHDGKLEGQGLALALASTRTQLYPLFLDLVRPLTQKYAVVPWIQWALFMLAIVYFWHAMVAYCGSRWFAFSVSLPLALPCGVIYFTWLLPDALTMGFALMAISSTILLAARPSSRLAWIGLTGATFLAYQAKPVAQLLVVLLPVLALLLRMSIEPRGMRSLRPWFLRIALATTLPLFLFCTLRFVVVGRFSLVSFNGYNLAGIAAKLIDEDVVAALPEEHRPLAERIMEKRRGRGRKPFSKNPSMRSWRKYYVSDQWHIAEKSARQIVGEEIASGRSPEARGQPLNLLVDQKLEDLSKLVLRRHPRAYAKWVRRNVYYGLHQFYQCAQVSRLLIVLLVSLPLVLVARMLTRKTNVPRPPAAEARARSWRTGLGAVTLVATSFFLGSIVLFSLVSWPMVRYMAFANLLLPSVLGGALFVLWASVFEGPKLGQRSGTQLEDG